MANENSGTGIVVGIVAIVAILAVAWFVVQFLNNQAGNNDTLPSSIDVDLEAPVPENGDAQ